MLTTQRKIELFEKYRRQEAKLKECINFKDFSTMEEGFFMNRKAGKPDFMTDESIAEAAAEFARKDAEKKLKRNREEQQQQNTNKGEEGKRKPYLKLTKGRLGSKIRKKDDDGSAVQVQQMERDIQGMDTMHWKVQYKNRDLEELKKALEAAIPNIYDLLYEAFELYTDQRKRTQIELIKEVIFELKRDYNKEFNDLNDHKQEELYKIKERMDAIAELQQNLKQPVEEYAEKKHQLETPKYIFEVADDEIKCEKYLTTEEPQDSKRRSVNVSNVKLSSRVTLSANVVSKS